MAADITVSAITVKDLGGLTEFDIGFRLVPTEITDLGGGGGGGGGGGLTRPVSGFVYPRGSS